MRHRLINIGMGILFIHLVLGCFLGALAAEDTPSSYELEMLELINQARQDPLEMAAFLGVDKTKVLQDLPELATIMEIGLEPLRFNGQLYSAAVAHTQDMLENVYYASQSPDGRTTADRIQESGYQALLCGESLGLLGFNNFIEPSDAVRIIFDNMFLDELNPLMSKKRNILDPDLRDVGICLSAGTADIGGEVRNVYLVTCDFGTDELYGVEWILWDFINRMRADPVQSLAAMGIDKASASEALGEQNWILDQGLSPLALNQRLQKAARSHSRDMIEEMYFDSISPGGTTPADRVALVGYSAQCVGEALEGAVVQGSVDPLAMAADFLEDMIRKDLANSDPIQRTIFNPDMVEIGIGFDFLALSGVDGEEDRCFVVVADFARPVDLKSYAMGHVYCDQNGNAAYDYGEEALGLSVGVYEVKIGHPIKIMETWPFGTYQLEIPYLGVSEMQVMDGENILFRQVIFGQRRNIMNNINLQPGLKGN